MSSSDEMLHQIGGYDPTDAKRVIAALEHEGIPFEVESDHSKLTAPGRTAEMAFGMFPAGSQVLIFVPASFVERGEAVVARLFPV